MQLACHFLNLTSKLAHDPKQLQIQSWMFVELSVELATEERQELVSIQDHVGKQQPALIV